MSPELERNIEPVIRTASLDDVPAIRKMHANSWVETYPNKAAEVTLDWVLKLTSDWLTPEKLEGSREHFIGILDNPDHFYRVASDGDEILGIIHASKIDNKQHLDALYIDKSKYGTGLAQKMMIEVFGWFDLDKLTTLEVASYNERAITFYRKYGFEVDEYSEHICFDKVPVINMTRKGDK